MKKIAYISGVLSVNLFVAGVVLSFVSKNNASWVLLLGVAIFLFLFLPVALIGKLREAKGQYKWAFIIFYICALFFFFALLFQINHWSGGGFMLLIGLPLPFIIFLSVFFKHFSRDDSQREGFFGTVLLVLYSVVFASFLALGVSRIVLEAMVTSAQDTEQSQYSLKKMNEDLFLSCTGDLESAKLSTIHSECADLCAKIDEIKSNMVYYSTFQINIDSNNYGELDLRYINNIDEHYRAGMYLYISSSVESLRKRIREFKRRLEEFTKDRETQDLISVLLETNYRPFPGPNDPSEYWNNRMFPAQAYIPVLIGRLNMIENSVLLSEYVILQDYIGEPKEVNF